MLQQDEANTLYYFDEALAAFDPQGAPPEVWEICEDLALKDRVLGLYRFLLDYDLPELTRRLAEGGRIWAYYLMRVFAGLACRRQDLCLSNNGPFFSALAAGDQRCARVIALFTPKQFAREFEDLDDFLYTLILHQLVLRDPRQDAFMIKAFEDARRELEASRRGSRAEVLVALWNRDAAGFDAAMQALCADREREVADMNVARNKLDYIFAVESHLFVEGIALVRLACSLGWDAARDYRYVPLAATTAALQLPVLPPRFGLAAFRTGIVGRFDGIPELAPYRGFLDEYLAEV